MLKTMNLMNKCVSVKPMTPLVVSVMTLVWLCLVDLNVKQLDNHCLATMAVLCHPYCMTPLWCVLVDACGDLARMKYWMNS